MFQRELAQLEKRDCPEKSRRDLTTYELMYIMYMWCQGAVLRAQFDP